jgi:hypothetical protein
MIKGAVLRPESQWTGAYPTVEVLKAFGATRDFQNMSGANKAQLLKRVKKHLELERKRGGPIGLRTPNAVNGIDLAAASGRLDISACPELDPAFAAPPRTRWLQLDDDVETVVDAMPQFDESIIEMIFRPKGAGVKPGKPRVLDLGFRRLAQKSALKSFAFAPAELRGDRLCVWVSAAVPASMVKDKAKSKKDNEGSGTAEIARRTMHEVKICLEIVSGRGGDFVLDMVTASCGCKDGSRLCVHVAGVCLAHSHLKNELQRTRLKGDAICTSRLCSWIKPKKPGVHARAIRECAACGACARARLTRRRPSDAVLPPPSSLPLGVGRRMRAATWHASRSRSCRASRRSRTSSSRPPAFRATARRIFRRSSR